jgi:hypothetical protein
MENVMIRAVVAIAALTACNNSNYCPGNPHDDCRLDWDGGTRCTSDDQCSGATPACDTAAMVCVQCTAANTSGCAATAPVCGSDNACHACRVHSECASNACLADGSCANEADVAYVDPTGTGTTCSKAAPCAAVASALATPKSYVKLHGTLNEQVTINNRNVTLLADPGAKLTSTTIGIILRVDGTSQVAIYDLEISDAVGSTGIGISTPTGNMAKLTLRRVKVLRNAGGGISIAGGEFDIMNSVISMNGGIGATLGGVKIDNITGGTHRLDFSTISGNLGSSGIHLGVTCGTVLTPVTMANNIIYGNLVSGGAMQVGGSVNCTTTYSDIGPDTAAGIGNINADPMFVSAGSGDFHLTTNSPAKDGADPAATLDSDLDGDARPQGAARDMGADEFK